MILSVNYNPKFLKLRKWIQIDKVEWNIFIHSGITANKTKKH